MTRHMSEEERTGLLANLRTDGEWLRRAKHATTEVIDAGNTMLKAAAEIERLSSAERGMRETAIKLNDAVDMMWNDRKRHEPVNRQIHEFTICEAQKELKSALSPKGEGK